MAKTKFKRASIREFNKYILDSIKEICQVDIKNRNNNFVSCDIEKSYYAEWGEKILAHIIEYETPEILRKVIKSMGKYILYEDIKYTVFEFRGVTHFSYEIPLSQQFSIDGWGGCAEVTLGILCTIDLFPVNYYEYIRSNEWKQRRIALIKKRGYKCEQCNSPMNLQVHHITYENLGRELDQDLAVLCRRCHEKLHGISKS